MLADSTTEVACWQTAELTLVSPTTYENPFLDVEVHAAFVSPTGRTVRARGFHDGGGVWRVRLLADEVGEWSFSTMSTDAALNDQSGTLTVGPARAGDHGPVRVDKQRHFAHADGTPYFLLGTTLYMGLTGGPAELARTVSKLSGSPFTKVRFMLQGALLQGSRDRAPFHRDEDGTLLGDRPDERYFREVETAIRQLDAMGVQADVILFVPYFDAIPAERLPGGSPSQMSPEQDAAYVRYAVSRLAALPNVWWTIANEYDLFRVQKDWDALAAVIAEADPYGHLLSNHHSILGFFDNSRPWITHANLQDVLLQRRSAGPRHEGELALDARKIGKPVVVDEYGYEGDNGFTWGSFSGPEMVDMHWAIALAGAYASHGESFADEGDGRAFVGDAVSRLRFLRDVLEDAPFAQMEPADDILDYDGTAFTPSALALKGAHYLVRFPPPRELADWNLGNFGPATPSHPLPLSGDGTFSMTSTTVRIRLEEGVYRVDSINPWRMSVTPLGVVRGGDFAVRPRVTPGVLRFVRDESAGAAGQAVDPGQLFSLGGMLG